MGRVGLPPFPKVAPAMGCFLRDGMGDTVALPQALRLTTLYDGAVGSGAFLGDQVAHETGMSLELGTGWGWDWGWGTSRGAVQCDRGGGIPAGAHSEVGKKPENHTLTTKEK